jgi:hypothetical protein
LQPSSYGKEFYNQITISDSEKTLNYLTFEEVVSLGKSVCNSSIEWKNSDDSLYQISLILLNAGLKVDIMDRILPILRFQSIYELCPENISILENIFQNE